MTPKDQKIIPVTETALEWLMENTRDNARVQNFIANMIDASRLQPQHQPSAAPWRFTGDCD